MIYDIKAMVKDGAKVNFLYYRKGELWYETEINQFKFPVPIEDTGDGTFLVQDTAMMYMRYIRKHIQNINEEHERMAADHEHLS